MSLNSTIPTLEGDSSFGAYIANPAGTPRGAIIVIQEIFGVNPGIRQKCDKLAAEGWLAVAPDLFWRLQPGISLDPDVQAEFTQALDWMVQFNQDEGIRDIEATIHHIRRTLGVAKVGCVGYCLGGRLAYMFGKLGLSVAANFSLSSCRSAISKARSRISASSPGGTLWLR
jgi:carboxymethylenebutenolidase